MLLEVVLIYREKGLFIVYTYFIHGRGEVTIQATVTHISVDHVWATAVLILLNCISICSKI